MEQKKTHSTQTYKIQQKTALSWKFIVQMPTLKKKKDLQQTNKFKHQGTGGEKETKAKVNKKKEI